MMFFCGSRHLTNPNWDFVNGPNSLRTTDKCCDTKVCMLAICQLSRLQGTQIAAVDFDPRDAQVRRIYMHFKADMSSNIIRQLVAAFFQLLASAIFQLSDPVLVRSVLAEHFPWSTAANHVHDKQTTLDDSRMRGRCMYRCGD